MKEVNQEQLKKVVGGVWAGEKGDKTCTPNGPIIIVK